MNNKITTFPKDSAYFLEQNVSFATWQQQVRFYRDIFITRAETTWLLFTEDSYTFSLYFFALIAANKRIVLPPNGQPEQLKQCMESADIFLGSFADNSDKTITKSVNRFELVEPADKANVVNTSNHKLELRLDSDIVFFTSGSSGQSKAINKSFHQLILEVELLEKTFGNRLDALSDGSLKAIVMATVSHQHIYGLLFKLLWPIWSGRHLHLSAFSYPEHLVQQIISYQQSEHARRKICLISSPAYYHRLLSDNVLVQVKEQFSVLFSSGGPLHAEAAIELKSSLTTPVEVFGSTETGGIAWRQRAAIDDVYNVRMIMMSNN